jgi:hypothetical protein
MMNIRFGMKNPPAAIDDSGLNYDP